MDKKTSRQRRLDEANWMRRAAQQPEVAAKLQRTRDDPEYAGDEVEIQGGRKNAYINAKGADLVNKPGGWGQDSPEAEQIRQMRAQHRAELGSEVPNAGPDTRSMAAVAGQQMGVSSPNRPRLPGNPEPAQHAKMTPDGKIYYGDKEHQQVLQRQMNQNVKQGDVKSTSSEWDDDVETRQGVLDSRKVFGYASQAIPKIAWTATINHNKKTLRVELPDFLVPSANIGEAAQKRIAVTKKHVNAIAKTIANALGFKGNEPGWKFDVTFARGAAHAPTDVNAAQLQQTAGAGSSMQPKTATPQDIQAIAEPQTSPQKWWQRAAKGAATGIGNLAAGAQKKLTNLGQTMAKTAQDALAAGQQAYQQSMGTQPAPATAGAPATPATPAAPATPATPATPAAPAAPAAPATPATPAAPTTPTPATPDAAPTEPPEAAPAAGTAGNAGNVGRSSFLNMTAPVKNLGVRNKPVSAKAVPTKAIGEMPDELSDEQLKNPPKIQSHNDQRVRKEVNDKLKELGNRGSISWNLTGPDVPDRSKVDVKTHPMFDQIEKQLSGTVENKKGEPHSYSVTFERVPGSGNNAGAVWWRATLNRGWKDIDKMDPTARERAEEEINKQLMPRKDIEALKKRIESEKDDQKKTELQGKLDRQQDLAERLVQLRRARGTSKQKREAAKPKDEGGDGGMNLSDFEEIVGGRENAGAPKPEIAQLAPAAEEPAAEEPAAEKPAAEKPAAEKPAAEQGKTVIIGGQQYEDGSEEANAALQAQVDKWEQEDPGSAKLAAAKAKLAGGDKNQQWAAGVRAKIKQWQKLLEQESDEKKKAKIQAKIDNASQMLARYRRARRGADEKGGEGETPAEWTSRQRRAITEKQSAHARYLKHKEWRRKNPEKVRAQTRKHDKANPEQANARKRTHNKVKAGKIKPPGPNQERDHERGYTGKHKDDTVLKSTDAHQRTKVPAIKAGMESWERIGITDPLKGEIDSTLQLRDRGMNRKYLREQIQRSHDRMSYYVENDMYAMVDKENEILEKLRSQLAMYEDKTSSVQRRTLFE